MNVTVKEIQVLEGPNIVKTIPNPISLTADEVYTMRHIAEPNDETGVYDNIELKPGISRSYNGVFIKSDGTSEITINDTCMMVARTAMIDGATPLNTDGTIHIKPLYKIVDRGLITAAVQSESDPTKWTLTINDKNYLFSSIEGTPITGNLLVRGRSFTFSADGRIAIITIENVDLSLLEEPVSSDNYNTRVAAEIQRQFNYFFGEGYATATYNTTRKTYNIVLCAPGASKIAISASNADDLTYFGFVKPTYRIGTSAYTFPKLVIMEGDLMDMDGYAATIKTVDTIEVTVPVELEPVEADFVGKAMLLGSTETITYDVLVAR